MWAAADAALQALRREAFPEVRMSKLASVKKESLSRTIDLPCVSVDAAYAMMLASDAPFPQMLHERRNDSGFMNRPWRISADRSGGSKRIQFRICISKQLHACVEHSFLAAVKAADGATWYFGFTHLAAETIPMFGTMAQLQLITVIQPSVSGAGGSVVSFHTCAHFNHDMLKSAAGSAGKHFNKLLSAAESVALELSVGGPPADGADDAAAAAGGKPAAEAAPHNLLDFNMWNRLRDPLACQNKALVLHYLSCVMDPGGATPPAPVTEENLGTLQDLLGFHRHDAPIVKALLDIVGNYCKVQGYNAVVDLAPTLPATLEVAMLLHSNTSVVAREHIEHFEKLRAGVAKVKTFRYEAMVRTFDAWESLYEMRFEAEAAAKAVEHLATHVNGSQALHPRQVDTLADVLMIHIGDAVICTRVFDVMNTFGNKAPLQQHNSLRANVKVALQLHPALVTHFTPLIQALNADRASAASKMSDEFERRYASVVPEDPVFHCAVTMYERAWRSTDLYLSKSFMCFDGHIIALATIQRIDAARRYLVQPCLTLTTLTDERAARRLRPQCRADEDDDDEEDERLAPSRAELEAAKHAADFVWTTFKFSLWSRGALFEALDSLGHQRLTADADA
jgi:hypothetical protein